MSGGGDIWLKVDLRYTYFVCTIFLSEALNDQHFAEDTLLKKKKGVKISSLVPHITERRQLQKECWTHTQ